MLYTKKITLYRRSFILQEKSNKQNHRKKIIFVVTRVGGMGAEEIG